MSFVWFRKHEKTFLWGTVIFSVLLFATFSGFGSLNKLLQHAGTDLIMGEFTVQSTGQPMQVDTETYQRTSTAMNRIAYRGRDKVTEDDVWSQIMLVADAQGAGLDVSDGELTQALSGGQPITKEQYRQLWRDQLQFPSAREFENFMRERLLVGRWLEVQRDEAGIVSADDVYLRWRTDNELFDFDAFVFPDADPAAMSDPDDDALQAFWDDTPEPVRNVRYVDPARQDIVYAWLPLAGGAEKVPADKLAAVPEPDKTEVEARWHQVQASRWPDKTELDDETRAVLAAELKLVAYTGQVLTAFQALPEQTAASFTQAMSDAGLAVANPEGPLGPDELKALPDIGDENLPLFLARKEAGSTHFGSPFGKQSTVYTVFVESAQPSRPLAFDEAHDKLVKAWKDDQRGRAAADFRTMITDKTRELPEAAAAIAPIVEAAKARAEAQVAAQPELDEASKEALRKEVMDAAEAQEIEPRLAEFENKIWMNLTPPDGVTRTAVSGVSRSYARNPNGTEGADSLERFLKTNSSVFQLAVNAISQPLHHVKGEQTVIVRITGRTFPPEADMLADRTSMDASRKQLAAQRQFELQQDFTPEALKASHQLKVTDVKPGRPAPHPLDDGE